MREVEPREIGFGGGGGDAGQFAVGGIREAVDAAEAAAAGDLGIEIELRILTEAEAEEKASW